MINTQQVREEPVYFLFLLVLLAYFGYNYYLTFEFSLDASASVPRLVIYLSIGVILIDILLKTTRLRELLKKYMGDQSEDWLQESGFELDSELKLSRLAIEFGWVLSYCLAIYYVGFFISTAVYIFVYFFLRDSEEVVLRRAMKSGAFTIVLTGFVYVLYIEIMNVVSLFRLGAFI